MFEICFLFIFVQIDVDVLIDVDEVFLLWIKVGILVLLVDLCIVDEDMYDVVYDGIVIGEVVVCVFWFMQGYLYNLDVLVVLWVGGYFYIGDIGNIDLGGYLCVVDCIKDVIKIGGEWIFLFVLEDIIVLYLVVSEVVVIGISDMKWGECFLLLVVWCVGSEVSEVEIIELVVVCSCLGDIFCYVILDWVCFVDVIECISVGKINKKKLCSLYDVGMVMDVG